MPTHPHLGYTGYTGYLGDTASILLTMFGPQQHDSHVQKWRWHRRMLAAESQSRACEQLVNIILASYEAHRGIR